MYCKNCGNELGNDTKYCPSCGVEVAQDEIFGNQYESNRIFEMGKSKPKGAMYKAILFVAIFVGLFTFFYLQALGDKGPIYNNVLAVNINETTEYPDDEDIVDYIIESEGYIFVAFHVRDLEDGQPMTVSWYNVTDSDQLICSYDVNFVGGYDYGYTACSNNWTAGDYEVRYIIDGEVVKTFIFYVDTE